MPKRTDIQKVLVIGSGPIVIGQACEFDYSGTQAIKALREEGVEVVLLNSNPATVMTDPEFAHRTYIEPITVEAAEQIIAARAPGLAAAHDGRPDRAEPGQGAGGAGHPRASYGVRLIGASLEAINKAEDRQLFKAAMQKIGVAAAQERLRAPRSTRPSAVVKDIGFPAIIRPSFTLGGTGGGIAYNRDEFEAICRAGLKASPTSTLLVEESRAGVEGVRAGGGPRHARTTSSSSAPSRTSTRWACTPGTSITVAPAQTLTDKEYQRLRQASLAIIREIGVDTGGSNIQFGINPKDGRMVVIEMNPRVSPLQRAGLEGHRVSHREDRREAGHGLHAGRAEERHHPGHAGLVRADHRLRGGEDSALQLREVPRRRPHADHHDAQRWAR